MSTKAIIVLTFTLLLISMFFYLYPQVDILFSEWIYGGISGSPVIRMGTEMELTLARKLFQMGTILLLAVCTGTIAILCLLRDRPDIFARSFIFILAVLAVGPGLIVNTVLKDNWGRARPHQVVEFGGDKAFTPAWVISDQCARNCSFVSGEGAFAFVLLAPALLVRRRRRRLAALTMATALGAAVSMVRMAQGAHFLSDSVIGALIVALTAVILHRLILGRDKTGIDEK